MKKRKVDTVDKRQSKSKKSIDTTASRYSSQKFKNSSNDMATGANCITVGFKYNRPNEQFDTQPAQTK